MCSFLSSEKKTQAENGKRLLSKTQIISKGNYKQGNYKQGNYK